MTNSLDFYLNSFREHAIPTATGSKLSFQLLNDQGEDVYNCSAPFAFNEKIYFLGRVEQRESEFSRIGFFVPADIERRKALSGWEKNIETIEVWQEIPGTDLELQDPFFTLFPDFILLGGVEVVTDPSTGRLNYRTAFYRGDSVETLERFAEGPWGMKDLRLKLLPDGRILLFTRPQGTVGGRGTIGWTILNDLQELNIATIESATLLDGMFLKEEWGGANEIHILDSHTVGVLSHIAKFDSVGNRHYMASSFVFDLKDGNYRDFKIIAERENFTPGAAKRPDLVDVIFSGGLIRRSDKTAVLYCGTSDAESHRIVIEDPFHD